MRKYYVIQTQLFAPCASLRRLSTALPPSSSISLPRRRRRQQRRQPCRRPMLSRPHTPHQAHLSSVVTIESTRESAKALLVLFFRVCVAFVRHIWLYLTATPTRRRKPEAAWRACCYQVCAWSPTSHLTCTTPSNEFSSCDVGTSKK